MPFNMFPYTNLHNLNLDWILKAIKSAIETVQSFASRMTQAESDIQDLETSRVSYTENQTLTTTQKARARNNIGAASATDLEFGLVRYDTQQELTGEQQTTARGNIGAAPSIGTVRYNEAQELSAAYQTRARQNIGAASAADLTALGVRVAGDEDLIAAKMDKQEPRGQGALIMNGWYDEQAGESHVPVLAIRNLTSKQTSFLPGLHGADGLLLQAGDLTAGTTGPAYLEGIKTPVRDDQAANMGFVVQDLHGTLTSATSGTIAETVRADAIIHRFNISVMGTDYMAFLTQSETPDNSTPEYSGFLWFNNAMARIVVGYDTISEGWVFTFN